MRLPVLFLAFGLAGAASPAAAMGAAGVILDPMCLAKSAWAVDPASAPIQISGCRGLDSVPAPDADGWVNFNHTDDTGFTRVKLVNTTPAGDIVFQVQDNGGGSGTMAATVTGRPGGDGYMEKQGLKVE